MWDIKRENIGECVSSVLGTPKVGAIMYVMCNLILVNTKIGVLLNQTSPFHFYHTYSFFVGFFFFLVKAQVLVMITIDFLQRHEIDYVPLEQYLSSIW